MLLIIRLFFGFALAPFKLFRKTLVNTTRSKLFSPFKFAFKFAFIGIILSVPLVSAVNALTAVNPNAGDKITVNLVDSETVPESGLYPNNADGTINGLNLLLINSIETEGYVKELLTLLKDCSEGSINSYSKHLTLDGYLGIQVNESGSFFGILPKAYIPTTDNEVLWGQSKYGIPAEQMKIKSLTAAQGTTIAQNESNIYYKSPSGFYGLFQTQYIELSYKADKLGDENRTGNTFYYPDAISYLDGRVSDGIANGYDSETMKSYMEEHPDIINLIAAGFHNAGEHGFVSPLVYATDYREHSNNWWTSDELNSQATIELYEDLQSAFANNEHLRTKQFDSPGSRIVGTYLLCEAGWSLDQIGLEYLLNKVSWGSNIGESILGSGKTNEDLKNYFRSKVASLPISDSQAQTLYGWQSASRSIQFYGYPKGAVYKYKDSTIQLPSGYTGNEIRWINMETLGQIYSSLFGGSMYYGLSLKYAGVGVDPTNPDTYMNSTITQEGEWKPSGESAWMNNYPELDQSLLTEKRTAFLNEAYKWIGSWYTWGGVDAPIKDANGNWINGAPTYKDPNGNNSLLGFDCSKYVQYCAKAALNVSLTRTTYTQIYDSALERISAEEAKPGDIIYYYKSTLSDTHHVAIYLGRTDSSTDLVMHAPESKRTLEIVLRSRTKKAYFRIKGIDS